MQWLELPRLQRACHRTGGAYLCFGATALREGVNNRWAEVAVKSPRETNEAFEPRHNLLPGSGRNLDYRQLLVGVLRIQGYYLGYVLQRETPSALVVGL